MPSSILAEIEQAAALYPDNIALEMFRDEGDVRYTYRQAMDLVRALSLSLRDRGVGKGDRIAFLARLSPRWVIAYLGVLRCGAVVVPLDVEYGAKDLASILPRIDCRFIFSVNEKIPVLKEALAGNASPPPIALLDDEGKGEGLMSIEALFAPLPESASLDASEPLPEISPEDVATIFFTSGTTGKPKGVVIQHRCMVNTLTGIVQYIRVTAKDKALAVIPSHHIFASLANILMPLMKGGGITYPKAINSTELMKAMEKGRITTFPAVPQIFYLLHKKIFDEVRTKPLLVRMLFRLLLRVSHAVRQMTGLNPGPTLFPSVHRIFGGHLRLLVSAASYFDPAVIRDFHSLGFTVQQGYALTETFGAGTFTPYDDNVIGSAGKPLPGIQLKIVDKDESGVGEIAISGPSLMKGYLDDPEATAEVLRDGWFHTGDLATQDEAGNVFIRGRRKEMIVLSSGKKVYPEEIETHYLQFPYIKEMCVMGLADDHDYARSERLHAVIVPDFEYMKQQRIVNAREIVRDGVQEYSASLPKYKRILTYELQTEPLPRTPSKKLMRYKVVSNEANRTASQNESAGGQYRDLDGDETLLATEASRRTLEIIRRESRLDRDIHPDMNLELDLGFDSLQRIELLAQVEPAVELSLGDDVASQIFTVRDLLRTIRQRIEDGAKVNGKPPAPARITWKEIIASAATDDLAEKYIISPTPFSRLIHFLALCLIYLISRICFRVKVRGLENLPRERPFMICPNHQGYLDGPLVSSVLPYRVIRYMFTLGFTPFFSGGFKDWIARTSRVVPVDADTNLGRAMRIAAIGLKARQNLLIFPEGGLTCDGELQTFKKGVGILAKELNIPIVPVAIDGSFDAWSKVGDGVKFKQVTVTFGPPLELEAEDPSGDPDREYAHIALQIRNAISRLLADGKSGVSAA